ncbi:MAG TPA: hypothetical protein PKX16_04845 [Kiritimatiellia bacterium]|nr:hypothetical protein [Kiritimatiellia bacterium]
MPYAPNENPPRRWFAARAFMVQPKACLDEFSSPDANPHPNVLRLAYINILRALRTLHRLVPDNNLANLVYELEPFFTPSRFRQMLLIEERFWKNPDLEMVQFLYNHVALDAFFEVHLADKENELYCDYFEYLPELYGGRPKDFYPYLVEAGLAENEADAAARYGEEVSEILLRVGQNKAFRMVMKADRAKELKTIHRDSFWLYDELNNLGRDFPTSYKGKNFIP